MAKKIKKERFTEMAVSEIKLNEQNPRTIDESNLEKLAKSIKDFPEMLQIRPIVLNKDMVILGGNMRFQACIKAGLKSIPVIIADNLTPAQEKEFIIKDNVSGGEWDWEMLNDNWDMGEMNEWGLEMPDMQKDFFPVEGGGKEVTFKVKEPTASDDDYSTFEIVMLHENKLKVIEALNKAKLIKNYEKQEDAFMYIINKFLK